MSDDIPTYLGNNLRGLRELRGLSQQQAANLAGIPRATWTHLESGVANPTLSVLVKVANALQLRLEELIGPPKSAAKLYRAASSLVRKRGSVSVTKLLPEALAGLELERMVLPAKARMAGVPHTAGTREYLTCESGRIELSLSGEIYQLDPGDVVVFRGDQKHGYHNPGQSLTIAYSVIAFAPVAGSL